MINADIWHCEVFFRVAISVGIWRKESTPFTFAIQDWKKTSTVSTHSTKVNQKLFNGNWSFLPTLGCFERKISGIIRDGAVIVRPRPNFHCHQSEIHFRSAQKPEQTNDVVCQIDQTWENICLLEILLPFDIKYREKFYFSKCIPNNRKSQNLPKSVISDTPSH